MKISLLQLIGRVYESKNCEDFKLSSNENMVAIVLRALNDQGRSLTLSTRTPTPRY